MVAWSAVSVRAKTLPRTTHGVVSGVMLSAYAEGATRPTSPPTTKTASVAKSRFREIIPNTPFDYVRYPREP